MTVRDAALKALEVAKASAASTTRSTPSLQLPDPGRHPSRAFAATTSPTCHRRLTRHASTTNRATSVVVDLREEPRCERSWKRDGTVKERSDGGMLSDRDAEAVGV